MTTDLISLSPKFYTRLNNFLLMQLILDNFTNSLDRKVKYPVNEGCLFAYNIFLKSISSLLPVTEHESMNYV